MGWRQYTPSSNATTLESKKSDLEIPRRLCALALLTMPRTPYLGIVQPIATMLSATDDPNDEQPLA